MSEPAATRVCQWCGATVPKDDYCPECSESFCTRLPAHDLTADQREAELRTLGLSLEVPFEWVHKRIEHLLGRPVWTHEFGLNWEGLCREARWEGQPSTMEEILDLIPAEKRLIVSVDDEPSP